MTDLSHTTSFYRHLFSVHTVPHPVATRPLHCTARHGPQHGLQATSNRCNGRRQGQATNASSNRGPEGQIRQTPFRKSSFEALENCLGALTSRPIPIAQSQSFPRIYDWRAVEAQESMESLRKVSNEEDEGMSSMLSAKAYDGPFQLTPACASV